MKTTRRAFLKTAGIAAVSVSGAVAGCRKKEEPAAVKDGCKRIKLGMASYTFRKFSLEDTLAMTNRLGLKYIGFKSFHLPLESTEEEIKSAAAKVKEAGIDLYACGVVVIKKEDDIPQAFKYAKAAGMRIINGVTRGDNFRLLKPINEAVQEYDIKFAIHNHGPDEDLYTTPERCYNQIKDMDPRMGLCIDIGHTQRSGVDPAESIEMYFDRLFDLHIKDVTAAVKEGKTIEIGRGIIDIPKVFRTLIRLNYRGVAEFEFEKDPEDPLPGTAESVGYVKGVLSVI